MIQRPKGTKDIYGINSKLRDFVKRILYDIAKIYDLEYIETPIFENTEVFTKSSGESSDIINKEMYTFLDKGGRSISLRPEGTAGAIRAIVENKLWTLDSLQKFFYFGPMFRYERPQFGRQRQFTQFGIEFIGNDSPHVDLEVILIAHTILSTLKIDFILEINYLGDYETQEKYKESLKKYFLKNFSKLSADSKRRIDTNVLRILDSKDSDDKKLFANAPKIDEYYHSKSKSDFDLLKKMMDKLDINYQWNKNLVRGLDYYSNLVFEFIPKLKSDHSQSTIIGGGRYNNLLSKFDGPNLSGIGFGIGFERLCLFANENNKFNTYEFYYPDIFIANLEDDTIFTSQTISYTLRKLGYIVNFNLKSTKKIIKLFKKFEDSKAKLMIIVGKKELQNNNIKVRLQDKTEKIISIDNLIEFVDGEIKN